MKGQRKQLDKPKNRSERHDIALDLAQWISEQTTERVNTMTNERYEGKAFNGPYGGYEGRADKKGKPHTVLFSIARYLDGVIYVYGKSFILVSYQTSFRDLPREDNRVFESVDDAKEFLKLAFVENDAQAALEIETK
jgi:hypothetical protein